MSASAQVLAAIDDLTERPTANWGTIGTAGRDSWLQTVVAAWLFGVVVLSLRLAGGWVLVRRMAVRGTIVDAALSARIRGIASRLRLRQTVVGRRSSSVGVPTVVGWLRPTILLPASALTGLAPEQLEAVLAHELAHIRRHDYGINVLQRLAETLLFYHPAVWWLSSRIRMEREMCADDLAVSVCGDPTLYAGALRDLEAVRTRNALAMAATGGSLRARVSRLLGQPPVRDRWAPVWTFVILASILLVAGIGTPPVTTMASPEVPEVLQEVAAIPIAPGLEQDISNPGEALPIAEIPVEPLEATIEPGVRLEVSQISEEASFLGVPYQTSEVEELARVVTAARVNALAPEHPEVLAAQAGNQVNVFVSLPASQLGLRIDDGETEGVLVQSVDEDSAAAEAGIQAGDLITQFAGTPVLGVRQLTRMLQETPDGRTVPVTVVRDGQARNVEVTVERRVTVPVFADVLTGYREAATVDLNGLRFRGLAPGTIRLGVSIESMTPELREFFGAPRDQGVLVSSVVADSAAAEAGILVGDVIVSVDGNDVSSPAQLTWSAELEDPTIVLEVIRDRRSQEIRVTLDLPARSLRIAP